MSVHVTCDAALCWSRPGGDGKTATAEMPIDRAFYSHELAEGWQHVLVLAQMRHGPTPQVLTYTVCSDTCAEYVEKFHGTFGVRLTREGAIARSLPSEFSLGTVFDAMIAILRKRSSWEVVVFRGSMTDLATDLAGLKGKLGFDLDALIVSLTEKSVRTPKDA